MTKDYRVELLKQLQAKGKAQAKGAKTPLLQACDLIDGDGMGHFDQYRNRLDAYHRKLYLTYVIGSEICTQEQLDNSLTAVLMLLLPSEKVESIIKTFGSHSVMISHKYGKVLTAKAKTKIKGFQAQIKKLENSEIEETEKLEAIEALQDKIKAVKGGNSYEVAIYRNTSEGTFRRQFEDYIILKLANLEITKLYSGTDFTGSKKWVSWLSRAERCDGVDLAKVDAFKQACDFDGLKEYIKNLEAAYKLKKLEAAEKGKKK